MKLTTAQLALMGMATSVVASAVPRNSYPTPPRADNAKANAVKNVFKTSWAGYYKYAFPNDNLHPVDNTFDNDR